MRSTGDTVVVPGVDVGTAEFEAVCAVFNKVAVRRVVMGCEVVLRCGGVDNDDAVERSCWWVACNLFCCC